MTTEVDPNSRIQILDAPILAPGMCLICGIADGRKFVDFGKQVEWYGAVYFCSECFAQVARALGFIPVAEFDALHNDLREANAQKDIVEAQNEGIKSALDTLFSYHNRGIVSVDEFIARSVSSVEEPKLPEGIVEGPVDGESKADEPIVSEGSDDIFDLADFDDD